jgi:Na+-translocating ferredoxin:NAD+ oxidoreductase RNF subunit RnfB
VAAQYHHSLRFDSERCDGCMSCMRACPTAAVRVRQGRAVKLEDRCIDCGGCIKACPLNVIVPLTDQLADLSKFAVTVAIPSPALYAQLDPDVLPGRALAALKKCGFDDAEPLSPGSDASAAATERFLNEHRGQFPVISSFCPTVVRLVQVKYPELVEQLLPVLSPMEISAREAKDRKARQTGLPREQIGAVYLTPCPAKMVAILEHPGLERSNLDTAVSISDLFQTLAAAVSGIEDSDFSLDAGETASGVGWAFLGGFLRTLPAEDMLSVAGLPNVIRILDDVEKGRLRKYSFIECHACSEGCVGGPLTVEDPYVARSKAIRMMQRLPAGPSIDFVQAEQQYRFADYLMDEPLASRPLRPLDEDIARAIVKMKERDRIFSSLPKIDCGACGAPTCRAFAEDVVQGNAERANCVFFYQRALDDKIEDLARLIRAHRSRDGGAQ